MDGFPQELAIAMTAGVLRGSVYALVALGIVLVYRASGVFNFAQAEFGTTGLFAAYAALELWGWSYPAAFAFGMGVAIAMGLLTERLVIHPLRNASRVTLLVGTAGVALAAIGLQFWLFNETLIMTMPKISERFFVTPVGCAGHDAGADRGRRARRWSRSCSRCSSGRRRGWRSRPPSRSRSRPS